MVDSVECCEVKRGAKNKQKQPRESEQLDWDKLGDLLAEASYL